MLHVSISLRALVFVLLLGIVVLTGSDVVHGAPSMANVFPDNLITFQTQGQDVAHDINTLDNKGGLRLYGCPALTVTPNCAAIQFFGNASSGFPGQLFLDAGSTANGAIIFRSAASGAVSERMRVTADGKVGIGTSTPVGGLSVVSDSSTASIESKSTSSSGDAIRGTTSSANAAGVRGVTDYAGPAIYGISNSTGFAGKFDGDVGITGRIRLTEQLLAYGSLNLGFGQPPNRLYVANAINDVGSPDNHVALIENTSTGDNADVLALRIKGTGNPAASNNFVTFFKGNDASVGALEGNGAGSVQLASAGSDYAEWLARRDTAESIAPGDIVGVVNGQVSKSTLGAVQVMVVSSGAIVAGNDPGEENRDGYALTAFIGQTPVRVRGAVHAGDFVLASGNGDGIGVAVAPEAITQHQLDLVVGQAWSDAEDDAVHWVNVAVGLPQRNPTIKRLVATSENYARRIAALEEQNSTLEARLASIEQRLNGGTAPLVAAR